MLSLFRTKQNENNYLYLDNASATPVDSQILETFHTIQKTYFANPSSIHRLGIEAKKHIDVARKKVATALQARPEEIVFTASATEANNLVIYGVIESAKKEGIAIPHVITTAIEHASILEPLRNLESQRQITITIVPVTSEGIVEIKSIREALTPETVLVSVIHANNEVGTIQLVREIGKMVEKYREAQKSEYPYFHTDSCQAINYLDIRPEAFRIDLCTLNSSKIYAPRGAGILYVRKGVKIDPQIIGGDQEHGMRAGTENTAAIVACGEAIEKTIAMREGESTRLYELQKYGFQKLREEIVNVKVWGSEKGDERLPNNINISVPGIFSEEFVVGLDMKKIAISSKSACGMSEDVGSYVIRALGGTEQESKEAIRISMGRNTTRADIDRLILEMKKIVNLHEKARFFLG
ncbi:MAG: cysteine desulfurase family protein [Minisyncoccia bacterium]